MMNIDDWWLDWLIDRLIDNSMIFWSTSLGNARLAVWLASETQGVVVYLEYRTVQKRKDHPNEKQTKAAVLFSYYRTSTSTIIP